MNNPHSNVLVFIEWKGLLTWYGSHRNVKMFWISQGSKTKSFKPKVPVLLTKAFWPSLTKIDRFKWENYITGIKNSKNFHF